MTIITKDNTGFLELLTAPEYRVRRFYKRDKNGHYFIPEAE